MKQNEKRLSTDFVRTYIEENLYGSMKDEHLSQDESKWFVSLLVQLEQAEALKRIAAALEPTIRIQEVKE